MIVEGGGTVLGRPIHPHPRLEEQPHALLVAFTHHTVQRRKTLAIHRVSIGSLLEPPLELLRSACQVDGVGVVTRHVGDGLEAVGALGAPAERNDEKGGVISQQSLLVVNLFVIEYKHTLSLL